MTPQLIHLAFLNWKAVHFTIHGEMSLEETLITNELCDFLTTVCQAESVYDSGFPYSQDLKDVDAVNSN